jgi:hypothetical protein
MNFNEWLEQQKDGIAACDHVTFGQKVWVAGQEEGLMRQLDEAEDVGNRMLLRARTAERQLDEARKQIVMLREALHGVVLATDPSVMIQYATEVLAATDDLSGCILCDATPDCWRNLPSGGYPVYKERAK